MIKGNWYIEWNLFSHHEQTVIHVGLQLPTPKDKTFFISLSLFWCSIFWLEIHYQKSQTIIDVNKYVADMIALHADAIDKWYARPDRPTKGDSNE